MINFTKKGIELTEKNYTFDDIYAESVRLRNNLVIKQGAESPQYLIKTNLYIGDGINKTTLSGKNISVTILGSHLQIKENSNLYLGELDKFTKNTSQGVKLDCPNIVDLGFGSNNYNEDGTSQSGNLFIYGSIVNINAKWSFHNKQSIQRVEILNSSVIGYGVISGKNSVLDNVMFISHGKFGILTPKNNIKHYSIQSRKSTKISGKQCSVMFNPNLGDVTITNSTFNGYNEALCNILKNDTSSHKSIIFEDCELLQGFNAVFDEDGLSSSSMIIRDTYSLHFPFHRVSELIEIKDKNENIILMGNLDNQKKFNVKLTKMVCYKRGTDYFNNYKVTISNNIYNIYLDRNTNSMKELIFL